MMALTTEGDPYAAVHALLREIRERVADDVHDLIVERQAVAEQDELTETVRQVGRVAQRVAQARGRQLQARENGSPVSPAIRDEREALEMLRATVISLACVAASCVVKMDFDARRSEVEC